MILDAREEKGILAQAAQKELSSKVTQRSDSLYKCWLDDHTCARIPSLKASSQTVLPCAHRTRLFRGRAVCERKGYAAGGLPRVLLLDAGLALLPPHILHDLINIRRSDGVDLRHVAEFPVVCLDADWRPPV